MLHLNFAPSLDLLVTDLLSKVRSVWTDPFDAPEIAVPSPALGKWLRMRLADAKGIENGNAVPFNCVANLELPTIEKFLWQKLEPGNFLQLDQANLQQIICALLDEEHIARPEFAALKMYLDRQGGIDPLKRVQLAARIAHQFLEYEYNRPGVWREAERAWRPEGIDGAWMRGRRYLDKKHSDEPWQAQLYREVRKCIFGNPNADDAEAPQYCTLPQLYRLRREHGSDGNVPWTVAPAVFFMFGVTKVSHFHRNLFVEMSQIYGVDLHVYLTNPCAEFWEDVHTSRSTLRRTWKNTAKDGGISPRTHDDYNKEELSGISGLKLPADHHLLELWGSAGKENIFLWCQDAQWNFDYRSPARADDNRQPETVLESLQLSLLRRDTAMSEPVGRWKSDGSLRILACPDRGREIEEIREQLLDLVKSGTIGMLNDVVVYLTDVQPYIPYIQRVFGCYRQFDPEYIPFTILGTSGSDTLFAQGVKVLLEVMNKRFDRAHVFELLRNPIVQTRRGFSADTVTVWERWADALGIFRGYDLQHRRTMGDTGGALTDAHTFKLGIARMLLADLTEGAAVLNFHEHDPSGNPRYPSHLPVLPYRDFASSDRQSLEMFCVTIESLYLDEKSLRDAVENGIEEGVEAVRVLVTSWLGALPEKSVVDAAAEGTMLRSFYDALSSLLLQTHLAGRVAMPFDEFIITVLGCLPDEAAQGNSAFTGGITFAPLRPSMVVPHPVIFAAGLDDVLFPGSNERPSWDLLAKPRIIGDSDRVRDNRFAFLELVHAAGKKLVLSYRSKDMQKESELHPSSVVQELMAYLRANNLEKQMPDGKKTCMLLQEIPWILHESLAATVALGRTHGTWNRAALQLARLATLPRKKNRYELTDGKLPEFALQPLPRTSLYDVRSFFKNPLEYHLTRTLGIELDESPATLSATDEPLDSGKLAISSIQKRILTNVLHRIFARMSVDAVESVDELTSIATSRADFLYAAHVATGAAPEAMQETMERDFLIRWSESCTSRLLLLKETFPNHCLLEKSDVSLGREGMAGAFACNTPDGTAYTVGCRHQLAIVPRNSQAAARAGIIGFKKEGTVSANPDLWIAGVLQWLAEQEREQAGMPITLVQINYSDASFETCRLIDNRSKKLLVNEWLGMMIGQIADRRCEHLPFAVIEKLTRATKSNPQAWSDRLRKVSAAAVAHVLSDEEYGYVSFVPAFKLVEAQPPGIPDEELRELADKRFAPMLDGWIIDREDTE